MEPGDGGWVCQFPSCGAMMVPLQKVGQQASNYAIGGTNRLDLQLLLQCGRSMQVGRQLDAVSVPVTGIYSNVDQVVIRITEDKLRLILGDYEAGVRERRSWMAPLGICVTVLATLTTGTANGVLLPEDYWLPVYPTAGLSALVWLIASLARRKSRPRWDIDVVVQSVKNAR